VLDKAVAELIVVARSNAYICNSIIVPEYFCMNETQRQAYLKAMGIQVYFPRQVLLGAKRLPDYGFPKESAGEKGAKPQIQVTSVAAQPVESVSRIVVEATAAEPEVAAEIKLVVEAKNMTDNAMVPAEELSAKGELRFSLQYFKINDQIAVINEIPHVKSNQNGAEAIKLLKAILLALGVDSSECQFEPGQFNWPIATNLPPRDDQQLVARNALLGYIRKRQEEDKFTNLILFCTQIESLLQSSNNSTAAHDFEITKHGFHITVTSSLQAILSVPSLKRGVWQDLQILKSRLETASV
jgi:DNA polymerase III psi subunit